MPHVPGAWQSATTSRPEQWRCGHCNQLTRSNLGFIAMEQGKPGPTGLIKICGNCNCPTFVFNGRFYPAAAPAGEAIRNVPGDVEALFVQARAALSAGAPVAAALTCRKILHHVAVERRGGGGPFANFKAAVEWLNEKHYLPPNSGDTWVDFIRDRANEENHQIVIITPEEAGKLVELTAHLLRHIYDLPKP